MEAGYKVFRTEVPKRIRFRSDRFGIEPEVAVKLAKLGYRLYEVPIAYYGKTYAEGKRSPGGTAWRPSSISSGTVSSSEAARAGAAR